MKVVKTASGKFRISEGDYFLEINQASYEDLYYALPLDPPTLFLLLNETVLSRKEDRETLKKMVAVYGNIQQGMPILAREVAKCDPKAEAPAVVPDARPAAAHSPGTSHTSLAGLVQEVAEKKPEEAVPPARPPGKSKTRGTKKSKVRKPPEEDDIPVAEVVTPSRGGAAPPQAPVARVVARGEPPVPQKKSTLGILRTPEVEFLITDGESVIKLTQKRYEELYRALPLDNTTLYRFLNDNVLTNPEERERFQEMVRRAGGTDAALGLLAQQVKMMPPDATAVLPAKRPSTAEVPAAVARAVVPAPPRPAAAPAAPKAVPQVGAPAPATPPKPASPAPVAPRPAAQAGAPPPVPPAKKPSSYITPTAPMKAMPPAPAAQKPQKAGSKFLNLEVETVSGEKFRIIFGHMMFTLGKAEYQELYYSLPSDNVSLFRLLFTKLLPDAESRNTLKKMVEAAGSNKLFFDSLQIRVREVAPTDLWD